LLLSTASRLRDACAGTLPAEWGTFAGQGGHVLSVAGNALQGALPPTWQAMAYTSLGLDLSSNTLSGPIPAGWFNTSAMANRTSMVMFFNLG
jgi:hypothetical protein